ncbi:MAG: PLP-dependent aminotransferase family protein [Pseudomonadota bacterium]
MTEPLEIAALYEKFAPTGAGKAMALRIAVRQAVRQALLRPMDELPSTRQAAKALSMSRNSVIEAYDGLTAEGVIQTRRGARPRVCALPGAPGQTLTDMADIPLSQRGRTLSAPHRAGYHLGEVEALAPGLPDPALFPQDAWATALRRAARQQRGDQDMYAAFEGLPDLREALTLFLRRHRGVTVDPDQIIVTPGTQSALALMADLVSDPGDEVWMEDPGYAGGRAIFEARGLQCRPLPDPLSPGGVAGDPRILYATPSTQYPTGTRMKLNRRLDILALAEARQSIVFEDDYDGDFVWRGTNVPPIFSLDKTGAVVLIGTVSKSLMPGLRLGWILVPKALIEPVREAHRALGYCVNVQVQAALADFIRSGQFARHLRRSAKTYQQRMDSLTTALRAQLGNHVEISFPDGGLQTLVRIDADLDDRALSETLWHQGFQVLPLSRLCIESPARGLVVGFARADDAKSERFARALAQALDEARPVTCT